jgi:hypothetical protein
MARTLFFIRSSLGSSTVKASTYLTHPVFSRVSGERFFRRSAAHRAFDRQTTAFGVAQRRFEVVCERPPAAFRRLSPSQRGRIFNLPLMRGRRERSERGGRLHTILKLQLSNTPEGRGSRSGNQTNRGASKDSFAPKGAHTSKTRNHGLQPWVHSFAAPRLHLS